MRPWTDAEASLPVPPPEVTSLSLFDVLAMGSELSRQTPLRTLVLVRPDVPPGPDRDWARSKGGKAGKAGRAAAPEDACVTLSPAVQQRMQSVLTNALLTAPQPNEGVSSVSTSRRIKSDLR